MSPDQLLQSHLDLLRKGDADALAALYHDDAALVSFDFEATGRDAIRDHYRQFLDYHGGIASAEPLHQRAAGDALFVLFRLESARGRFELVNVFLLDGDRIRRHFSNTTKIELKREEVETEV